VFRGRDAVSAGLLTRSQLRGRAWRRLFQGVYVDSSVPISYVQRCAVARAFCLPAGAVIAGRSAAAMYGAGLDDPVDAVEVLVPCGIRLVPYTGLILHQGDVLTSERRQIRGMAVTSPERTGWDLACWLAPVEAVVFVDRMLARGITIPTALGRYLDRRRVEVPPPRGLRRFTELLALADGGSESPQESRLRARLVLAGLPRPHTQFTVVDRTGRFVARVDLAWPDVKVAVEYDGLWHVGSKQQIHHDRQRLNALVGAGWTVLHVTSARLRDDLEGVVSEIRSAIRRAR
jgi:very-short-patch-repair endonuclease